LGRNPFCRWRAGFAIDLVSYWKACGAAQSIRPAQFC
jgi:hypothetical protein